MSNIFLAVLAGFIQGISEFLPISSSGHLVIFHDFLNFNFPDNLAFDVVLHLGTLLALLIFFWADVWRYVVSFFSSFRHWNVKNNIDQKMAWLLLMATIPAVVVGYLFDNAAETYLRSSALVAIMLIVFGIILYVADRFLLQVKSLNQITVVNSLVIGFAQAIALIPGVSRSGITIIAGLSQKFKRQDAARFSFLLSMPIIFGAGAKKIIDLMQGQGANNSEFLILTLGFISSALTGYFCIKFFLSYLQNHSLKIFAYYRIIIGIVILIFLYFR
ncbi:MAG: undecaprenyl-diphosphatase UppP [Patescibacteria group bacterium]|nr:undecaprenyl-diphosphatase UppP [Patescibacteria group bacterium]